MPEVKEISKHFSNNDKLAILSVSMDGTNSAQRLRDTIRDKRVNYPVLHVNAEDGWNDGAFDWEIQGVPSSFIIDPQGNIFADVYPQKDLIPVFDWLAAQETDIPPLGLTSSHTVNDDGSITVKVNVSSPTHAPIKVDVSAMRIVMVYDPERDTEGTGEPNSYEYQDLAEEGNDFGFTTDFGDFGEATHEFTIPAQAGARGLYLSLSAVIPGMEELNDGAGFSMGSSDYIQFPVEEEE